MAACEVIECAATLVLAAIRMDGLCRVPRTFEAAAGGVGAASRACEHDNAFGALLGEQRLEKVGLERLRDANDMLLYGVCRFAFVCDLHEGRIV